MQLKFDTALRDNEAVSARVEVCEEKYLRVCLERNQLKKEVKELTDTILELEARKVVLSYDDLRPGGALADSIGDFTFFPDLTCNEAFLNLINYTEVCEPGDGFCKNMVRYHHVGVQERLRF